MNPKLHNLADVQENAALKADLEKSQREASRWYEQAVDNGSRAEKAEARVAELEGWLIKFMQPLPGGGRESGTDGSTVRTSGSPSTRAAANPAAHSPGKPLGTHADGCYLEHSGPCYPAAPKPRVQRPFRRGGKPGAKT